MTVCAQWMISLASISRYLSVASVQRPASRWQQAVRCPARTIFHISSSISRQDANAVHKLHLDCFTSCLPDFDELSFRLLPTDPRHSSSHKFNKRREEKRSEEKRSEEKRREASWYLESPSGCPSTGTTLLLVSCRLRR